MLLRHSSLHFQPPWSYKDFSIVSRMKKRFFRWPSKSSRRDCVTTFTFQVIKAIVPKCFDPLSSLWHVMQTAFNSHPCISSCGWTSWSSTPCCPPGERGPGSRRGAAPSQTCRSQTLDRRSLTTQDGHFIIEKPETNGKRKNCNIRKLKPQKWQ